MDTYVQIKYCSTTQLRNFKSTSRKRKRYCHQEFKLARRNFDKKLRYSERSFLKEQQKSIEESTESGDFWKKLLGNSKKSKTIPMKIKNPDGST